MQFSSGLSRPSHVHRAFMKSFGSSGNYTLLDAVVFAASSNFTFLGISTSPEKTQKIRTMCRDLAEFLRPRVGLLQVKVDYLMALWVTCRWNPEDEL
jgi:hypothetical protein